MAEGIASMSDLLLQIVAIRLAALLLAGLVLRAMPEQYGAPSPVPPAAIQREASVPELASDTDPVALALRDMRLHD